ncbi:hypothetical protein SAMN05660420_01140 [Desulfuromusa kysingii]|uniref:Uncharacterized protein n=2 Tax=Desulfuromusa kysingii TaxID=37625 RepID=A0A1H3Y8K1_9BACT|nr:hypothetical protein SAMN05660420_01140 [Desulfuromusa kysingii]
MFLWGDGQFVCNAVDPLPEPLFSTTALTLANEAMSETIEITDSDDDELVVASVDTATFSIRLSVVLTLAPDALD